MTGLSINDARFAGPLGPLHVPLGLGLLRLATEGRPSLEEAIAVIHFALDRGIRVLDTADVYSLDHTDLHFGERLARSAVESWHGPRDEVRILTKVGLARPRGRWIPDGRPDHLRKSVDESRSALGVDRLFLLQLHAHDSRVPFEETLGTLAELQQAGKVNHLGLCNVTAGELRQAQRHFRVVSVQNELSVLQRKSAANGLVELTREQGIVFLAHRPLGGYAKVARLDKNRILKALSERHQCSPRQIALAALLEAGPHVIPLVGATRVGSIESSLAALQISLDVSDRTALELGMSFAAKPDALAEAKLLFTVGTPETPAATSPTTQAAPDPPSMPSPIQPNRPVPGTGPEIVILMGIQGAGKSEQVSDYVKQGYVRLNRDQLGGRLDDLVPRLLQLLSTGQRRVVLDNTYPTRLSRAPVIAAGHMHRVPVRCRHLQIPLAEAHVNIVLRMLAKYGRPLGPEEMKALNKTDPNLPPPAALMRFVSSFEPPSLNEGFAAVDVVPFVRRIDPAHREKGLLLDVDGTLRRTKSGALYPRDPEDLELLPGRREILARWVEAGYRLFFVSNQSGIASGQLARAMAEAAFLRTAQLLQLPVTEIAYCPHQAHPIACYCRKPMPGLGVYLMERHRLARSELVMVGDMASDAAFAAGLGARYWEAECFFKQGGMMG